MVRRKDTDITPDDAALWERVSNTVKPLPSAAKNKVLPPPPPVKKLKDIKPVSVVIAPAVKLTDVPFVDVTRGDKKRIKQGVLKPTTRLDLHGFTVARAEKSVTQFLQKAVRDGHDWAEIITGHGRFKNDVDGEENKEKGVLKRLLPMWLQQPGNRIVIKRVVEAPQSRGGAVWIALKLN